jgi:hypothetical protein
MPAPTTHTARPRSACTLTSMEPLLIVEASGERLFERLAATHEQ